ncbi:MULTISPECIES: hypothetical protein [unclassified Bradyrhizobium]|uniref:hypothetical protein n=1 Tax=unclassified Bradyrhizobium TaxID=2631580 RepID=UPI002FF18EAC
MFRDSHVESFDNPLTLASVREAGRAGARAGDLIAEACRRARAAAEDCIFTALVPAEEAIARAKGLQRRAARASDARARNIDMNTAPELNMANGNRRNRSNQSCRTPRIKLLMPAPLPA